MEAWLAIDIYIPSGRKLDDDRVGVLSAALFEEGAQGVEHKDASDPEVVVAAFPPELAQPEMQEGLLFKVQQLLADHSLEGAKVERRAFESVDWAEHWKERFVPLHFEPLWVVPSWLEVDAAPDRILRIDPSSAFGTGLHETTSLCIRRVIEICETSEVLDVGTGTGILAMVALKMGAERAVGVDNDPEAVRVAQENAEVNGLAERLHLSEEMPTGAYALVVANILAGPLVEMAPSIAPAVKPGGRLLLSGVLKEQAGTVAKAYETQGLTVDGLTVQGEWALIELARA